MRTAIVAGISALVLSENPSLSPDSLYARLISTAEGTHDEVNAWRAVTGAHPMELGTTQSDTCLEDEETETWTPNVLEGLSPFSYSWEVELGEGGDAIVVGADPGSCNSRGSASMGGL